MNEQLVLTPADRRRCEIVTPHCESRKPLMLLDVSLAIRAQGGQIWHLEKTENGTLFRANIGLKQFRVLVPMYSQPVSEYPTERGSPCHVATSLDNLKQWLTNLSCQ